MMCDSSSVKTFFYFLILSVCVAQPTYAQWEWGENLGIEVGIGFSLGTHLQRIGLSSRMFVLYEPVQLNAHWNAFYQLRSMGLEKKGWEMQAKLGAVLLWGKGERPVSPFLRILAHQSSKPYSVAYAYQLYLDTQGTSQWSGSIGLGIEQFSLEIENDFFAFQSEDCFRSGAIGLHVVQDAWLIGIRSMIWTGDPYIEAVPLVKDSSYQARYGYLDISQGTFGQYSLGVAALEVAYHYPFLTGQVAGLSVGWDDERIRHFSQNRLIHDNPALPINWGNYKNPHIPMLDQNGKPYLFLPDQELRRSRPFFILQANDVGYY